MLDPCFFKLVDRPLLIELSRLCFDASLLFIARVA